ncbi:MAG TPA: ATP-binding protein [Candidatus Deferrimicrobium sp.]|nr:ATP-binding protein [Candidatus Deferrimicrobium sp.]
MSKSTIIRILVAIGLTVGFTAFIGVFFGSLFSGVPEFIIAAFVLIYVILTPILGFRIYESFYHKRTNEFFLNILIALLTYLNFFFSLYFIHDLHIGFIFLIGVLCWEFVSDKILKNIFEGKKDLDLMEGLLKDLPFWIHFINSIRTEIESDFWDAKESLEMWKANKSQKEKESLKFCEKVAAFGNKEGGVIILGVTNEIPRKIIGIQDVESRIKHCEDVLKRYIESKTKFHYFQVISFPDEDGEDKYCLLLFIQQTKDVLVVKYPDGKFSCPQRTGTGLSWEPLESLKKQKENIQDNYNFIRQLKQEFDEN